MKPTTLRLIAILAAVLLLGTAALAVALTTQSPRASQIPTVVTSVSASETIVPSSVPSTVAPPAPAPSSAATEKPIAKPKPKSKPKPESEQGSPGDSRSTNSEREVVTPKVRDDGNEDHSSGDQRRSPEAAVSSVARRSGSRASGSGAPNSWGGSNSSASSLGEGSSTQVDRSLGHLSHRSLAEGKTRPLVGEEPVR